MIPYTKLNSHGNDFILVETKGHDALLSDEQIKHYSRRDVIGCDQFFIVDTSDITNVICEVFNQDGSRACQCGNGLRATMLYLNKKYNIRQTNLVVCGNNYPAEIERDTISIVMGTPKYIDRIKSYNDSKYSITNDGLVLTLIEINNSLKFSFIPLSIGNDHCVVLSKSSPDNMDSISHILNDVFDGIMNICFVNNANDFLDNCNTIVDVVVNERGAGYTDSCGSGATAAAICLFKLYELSHESRVDESKIKVRQKGGVLDVVKSYNPDIFKLVGPSELNAEGVLE